MRFDTIKTTFTRLSEQQKDMLVASYQVAVEYGDVDWLRKRTAAADLTPDNRRYLANLGVSSGDHALIHAVNIRNNDLLDFLLGEGALPDVAMPVAIDMGNGSAVGRLCRAKADANGAFEEIPYLNIAAYKFDQLSCQHLLDAGALLDGHHVGDASRTALFDCMGGYEKEMDKALSTGQPVDRQKQMAAWQTMGLLLQRGIDAHQAAPGSASAYDFARHMADRADPNPEKPDPYGWRKPLQLIKDWQGEPVARAQMNDLMKRLMQKPGGTGPA